MRLLWPAAGVAAAAVLCVVWNFPDDTAKVAVRALTVASGTSKTVALTARFDRNRLNPGETLGITFYVQNRTGPPVGDVWIKYENPGFNGPAETRISLSAIDTGATVIKTISLRAGAVSGRFRITGVYGWVVAGEPPSYAFFAAAPVEVTSDERQHLVRFARRLATLGKDLTLPVVLAVMGYLFQRKQKKREEDLANLKEDRDRRQQIWSSVLPRFHDYAETHYLPITNALRRLGNLWDPLKTAGFATGDAGIYFYWFMTFLRRMQYLREKRGGIFFRSRAGETVFSLAWYVFNDQVENRLNLAERDYALKTMEVTEDFATFAARESDPSFGSLFASFQVWIEDDFERNLLLINLMRATIHFEANRPFDAYWYEEPGKFEVKELDRRELPEEPKNKIGELIEAVKKYRRETANYISSVSRS